MVTRHPSLSLLCPFLRFLASIKSDESTWIEWRSAALEESRQWERLNRPWCRMLRNMLKISRMSPTSLSLLSGWRHRLYAEYTYAFFSSMHIFCLLQEACAYRVCVCIYVRDLCILLYTSMCLCACLSIWMNSSMHVKYFLRNCVCVPYISQQNKQTCGKMTALTRHFQTGGCWHKLFF